MTRACDSRIACDSPRSTSERVCAASEACLERVVGEHTPALGPVQRHFTGDEGGHRGIARQRGEPALRSGSVRWRSSASRSAARSSGLARSGSSASIGQTASEFQ
jgi:hypothetical protein